MIIYNLDTATEGGITGWAFSDQSSSPVRVQAWCGAVLVGDERTALPRPDVNRVHAAAPVESGFSIPFEALPQGASPLNRIRVHLSCGRDSIEITPDTLPDNAGTSLAHLSDTGADLFAQSQAGVRSLPFPRAVASGLRTLFPGAADEQALTDALISVLRSPRVSRIPSVVRYARYLRSVWSHFAFVERHFPSTNSSRAAAAKDWNCKANTPAEMLTIANQLYVLQSYGANGILAEFGCFKGYSTSMLSYACMQLGIPMHVFDSFEGLPPSESTYYAAGDFKGGLDEVQRHVELFGVPTVVTWNKGFFSDSLKTWERKPIICLWMDVDLESSAQDVMQVADLVVPEGSLFSHECNPHNFEDGRIVAERSPDNVIPAIVDKFGAESLVGMHVHGHTGAFWRRTSIPVLRNDLLLKIVEAA